MYLYRVTLKRNNRWDIYPQDEPHIPVDILATSEKDAIAKAVELPEWRVSPPICVDVKRISTVPIA